MSRKDYTHLTADEVTEQLGDLLEQRMDILRDKRKGTLRTLFGIAARMISDDMKSLLDAALEKNGIAKIQPPACYNYLPEIVAAVEARGSRAAEKIKRYDELTTDCRAFVQKVKPPHVTGPFAGLRENLHVIEARVMAAKRWPELSAS